MTKFTTGGTLTNISYASATENDNFHDIYFGFFRSAAAQSEAVGYDPDASNANKERLLETGVYRRLNFKGYPVNSHWYQPTSFKELRDDTANTVNLSTTIPTAFAASLALRNQPHGFDFLWCQRDRYGNPTDVLEKATLQLQVFTTACITLSQPLFSNF